MTDIRQGFLLHITTWENDGDSYKLSILPLKTKDEVRFFLEFAELFKLGKYGNEELREYEDAEQLVENYVQTHGALPYPFQHYNRELITYPNAASDAVNDIHDHIIGTWYDYMCSRVFEKAKLYYVPTDLVPIKIENLDEFNA